MAVAREASTIHNMQTKNEQRCVSLSYLSSIGINTPQFAMYNAIAPSLASENWERHDS